MARSSRVALALGSGGARGYAHIGVIAELQDRGFDIVTVAGSSMGALVGGLHCAGRLDDYVDWISGLSQLDVVRLVDVSLSKPGGVIGAERILARVREMLGDTAIEDLDTPFTAVATDLNAGRAVWFQRGSLVDAIRASIAIPGVISPHQYQGRLLGDGGILDPLPVAPTSAVPSDVTIGVILGSDGGPDDGASRESKPRGVLKRNVAPLLDSEFVRSVRDRFGLEGPTERSALERGGTDSDQPVVEEIVSEASMRVDAVSRVDEDALPAERDSDGRDLGGRNSGGHGESDDAVPDPADPHGSAVPRMGRIEVLSRSLDIMSEALTRYQVAGYPPDVLIRVPRRTVRTLDFHKATEMIELGRLLTAEALDGLPERP